MTETTHADYLAYTLRAWRSDKSSGWRAVLYNPQTGQRYSFASVEHLFAFLLAICAPTVEQCDPPK